MYHHVSTGCPLLHQIIRPVRQPAGALRTGLGAHRSIYVQLILLASIFPTLGRHSIVVHHHDVANMVGA